MGTAPDSDQHPAMPDPERLVSRSVRLIMRLGLPESVALMIIVAVVDDARRVLTETGYTEISWLELMRRIAYERYAVADPSVNDSQGGTSGDGPGRTASGAAEQEDRTPQG